MQSKAISAIMKRLNSIPVAKKVLSNTQPILAPLAGDPIVAALKARLNPFSAERGSGSVLSDGRPSQKFMCKGTSSISIPVGCYFVFMQAPNIASDIFQSSILCAVQSVSGTPLSGPWSNSIVGSAVVGGGTIKTVSTSTPYSATTLAEGYEWACTGSGARFTYEGAELYRSGIFRYFHDHDLEFNQNGADWTGKGPADVISFVDSAMNNIRQSINNNNIVEINTFHGDTGGYAQGGNYSVIGDPTLVGGTTTQYRFSPQPGVLGYFLNSSAAAISFHVEAVEHWAISGKSIQSLLTPSRADAQQDTHVQGLLANARQVHATQPNANHMDVLSTVVKASKSPIGHAVIDMAIRAALR